MKDHEMTMRVTPVVWDRTINLPFLATVAVALCSAIVWTSTVNSRLDRLEERTRGLTEMQIRVERMDERGENTKNTILRIEAQVNRLAERE